MAENEMLQGWRAPRTRLSVAYLICILNFVMYASDPICFAATECRILVIGDILNLLFNSQTYPREIGPLALKVFILILWLPAGYVLGRYALHHCLLRDCMGISMFRENQGTLGVQAIAILLLGYVAARLWPIFLALLWNEELSKKYATNNHLPFSDAWFSFFAQTGCTAGDVLTIVMLWDTMLQDTTQYSNWHPRLRKAWRNPYLRLGCVWTVSISVFSAIFTLVSRTSRMKEAVPAVEHWSQMERGFLAAFIFMLDVFVVCQDWEFPEFDNPLELKFFLWGSDRIGEVITGKWLNYGPMLVVMLIDANNLANQWRYGLIDAPGYYGQYLDSTGHIWTVANATLASALRAGALLNRSAFSVNRTRGACQLAVPYKVVGASIAQEPPCFPGDFRSGGQLRHLGLRPFGLSLVPLVVAVGVFTCTSRELPRLEAEKERRKLQEQRRAALARLRRASRMARVSIQLSRVQLRRRSSAPSPTFASRDSLARPSCGPSDLSPAARAAALGTAPVAASFGEDKEPPMWPALISALPPGSSFEGVASAELPSADPFVPPSWRTAPGPWTGPEDDNFGLLLPRGSLPPLPGALSRPPHAQHPDLPAVPSSSLAADSIMKPLVLPEPNQRCVRPKRQTISRETS